MIGILCIMIIWGFHFFTKSVWSIQEYEIIVLKCIALISCITACGVFHKSDLLRKIWLLFTLSVACYLIGDLISHQSVRLGLVTLGNICNLTGIYLLSRSFEKTDLEYSVSITQKQIIIFIMVLGILSICIPVLVLLSTTTELSTMTYIILISSIGDILSLIMLIPILYITFSMIGSLLMLPWIYLSGMMIFWIVSDILFFWVAGSGMFYSQSGALLCLSFAGIMYKRTLYLTRSIKSKRRKKCLERKNLKPSQKSK